MAVRARPGTRRAGGSAEPAGSADHASGVEELLDDGSFLQAYCERLLGDPHAAEDVVQETYLQAVQQLGRLERRESYAPWLATVARRRSANEVRRRVRFDLVDQLPEEWDGAAGDPADAVSDVDTVERVREAMAGLSERERFLLERQVCDELSLEELAREDASTPSSVKSVLNRARCKLRACLDDAGARVVAPIAAATAAVRRHLSQVATRVHKFEPFLPGGVERAGEAATVAVASLALGASAGAGADGPVDSDSAPAMPPVDPVVETASVRVDPGGSDGAAASTAGAGARVVEPAADPASEPATGGSVEVAAPPQDGTDDDGGEQRRFDPVVPPPSDDDSGGVEDSEPPVEDDDDAAEPEDASFVELAGTYAWQPATASSTDTGGSDGNGSDGDGSDGDGSDGDGSDDSGDTDSGDSGGSGGKVRTSGSSGDGVSTADTSSTHSTSSTSSTSSAGRVAVAGGTGAVDGEGTGDESDGSDDSDGSDAGGSDGSGDGTTPAHLFALGEVTEVCTSDCTVLFHSADGGATWERVEAEGLGDVWDLLVAPGYPDDPRIYAMGSSGLLRSTDGGETFSPVSEPHSGAAVMSPWFSEGDERILVGAKSSWVYDAAEDSTDPFVEAPVTATRTHFAFPPDHPETGVVFAGSLAQGTGGAKTPVVFRCGDGDVCDERAELPFGREAPQVFVPSTFADDGVVFAWTGNLLFRSTDGGDTFEHVETGVDEAIKSVTEARDGTLFVARAEADGEDMVGGLLRSTDGGVTWERVDAGGAFERGVRAVHALPDGRVLATPVRKGGGGLLCSADGGESWAPRCSVPDGGGDTGGS